MKALAPIWMQQQECGIGEMAMREKMIELLEKSLRHEPGGEMTFQGADTPVAYNLSPTEPKWIPVTEKLPPENTPALVYRKSGIYVEWRWDTYWDEDCFSDYPVTHWMPLPEAPKV